MTRATSILGAVITPDRCAITLSGTTYVRDNSEITRVRAFLGNAFEKSLDAAIAVSRS